MDKTFFKKKFPKAIYLLNFRREAPFWSPFTPKTHPEKAESEKPNDKKEPLWRKFSRKIQGHMNNSKIQKSVNHEKPKRANKEDETSSKSSH